MTEPSSSALASSASSTGRDSEQNTLAIPPVFSVQLPPPPSLNGNYRNIEGEGRARTHRYNVWLSAAANCINRARYEIQGWIKIETPVVVIMQIDRTQKNRDLDNCVKAIFDALQKNGIIADDSQVSAFFVCWSEPGDVRLARVALFHVGESPFMNFKPSHPGAATGQVQTHRGNEKEN